MSASRLLPICMLFALAACNEQVTVEEPEVEDIKESPVTTAEPLYVGVWAAKKSWCGVAPGSAVPSPIEITREAFIGYENRCVTNSAEEGTDGGWRLKWTCAAEGAEVEEVADIDIDGDRLRLSRNGGPPAEFVRCESAAE